MNIARKITAAVMLAGVLTVCGCSAESPRSGVLQNSAVTYSDEESSAISAFEIPMLASNTEPPCLTFLGTGEISTAALNTYANTVGLSTSETPVTIVHVSDYQYESRLSELINSDESPDLTEKRENTFPFLMSKNIYEDLTSYMDAAAPQWEEFSSYIDHYSFKGAHYFYPTGITVSPQIMLYDKMRCVQFNIPDPEKLYEKGEWTMDRLIDCAEQLDASLGIDSYFYASGVAENILNSTGAALIEKDENGKFVSRIGSRNYLDMRSFFSVYRCNQDDQRTDPLRTAMSMFMCTDERTLGELRTLSPSFNVGIVPFPQFDSDGTYYVRAVSEGFLVPKGAKNIRNAASFINCSRIAETSDDGIKERRREMKKLGLLQSDVEWMEFIRGGDYELVLDEGLCLDKDANAAIKLIFSSADEILLEGNAKPDYNIAAIDADLERINAML